MTDPQLQEAIALYLDLMKRCLANLIYEDEEIAHIPGSRTPLREKLAGRIGNRRYVVQRRAFELQERVEGRHWPSRAHTMIGMKRLDNLQLCIESVIADGIQGDLIETGVWRGGATILMRAVLRAYGITDRLVWVADSFRGLPSPDETNHAQDVHESVQYHEFKELAIPVEQVKANFDKYGLLDEQVRFLEGWFHDTLPGAPIERLAVARLDGDMYGSTIDALESLYPRLSPGGYLIVDDYNSLPECRQAVEDYRRAYSITEPIKEVDWTGVYWRRER
jgi:O-methyltransferase